MTDIARHPDPAFSGLEDALASEGAQAPAPAQEVPHFRALTRHDPYPWQRRLYARLVAGKVPEAVDVPTGCGKTACVLLALLAGLRNRSLPRRVVHIVDRRALVDQSADAVRGWVERMGAVPGLVRAFDACAAFPAARPVALGVLRGGHADEGAWRVDPARPAVVVGTVDMVGSRLLFAGYGSGRSRRAMDAGLLGHDALVLLDEAHLSPAMAGLLDAIAGLGDGRSFRVMKLSATAPGGCGDVLGLRPEDLKDERLRRRFRAVKRARLVEAATEGRRTRALADAAAAHPTGAVAVFVERVADARLVAARLSRATDPERVAVLTGTLRGRERAALASAAVWRPFSPARDRMGGERPSAYLVMTSAGEVGVDLDADHAVMDLAPLDSMVQRLGRVNRAGLRSSTVTVVHPAGASPKGARAGTPAAQLAAAKRGTLALLRRLPDLSPAALRAVDPVTFATCASPGATPAPEAPRTWLAWRRDVADLVLVGPEAAGAALSFFPLRGDELARAPTPYARRLIARSLAREGKRGLPLVVLGSAGEPFAVRASGVEDLPALEYATVVLPPFAGGLSPEATLPAARARPWACSRAEIRWTEEGFASQALHCLLCACGAFARDRHRALADCEAGVWLLAQRLPVSGGTVLAALRRSALRPTTRLWAVRAPFEAKEALRARGYRWMPEMRNGIERAWWTDVEPAALEPELAWLRERVYRGDQACLPVGGIPIREVSAFERWRADPADLAPPAVAYHRFAGHG